ncbi:hypothetical protein B0T20DRAFT_467257 [Sordaria brevicollis]|uniref:MYND-type domain-containing protein n=1 Tax=Sordaria brevicollis TaxID=83679 RepID=A0AAE0PMN0_SORBR|nr:hypothetical protein B0T20DRAFT_467257 [Sordaria brevicollis]
MLTPPYPSITSTFHPFGDTPAVYLTEHIPPPSPPTKDEKKTKKKKKDEEPVNILLLGSGDVRNVLFTTHMDRESRRRLDVTCCDGERLVVARNILLLTLLIELDHGPFDPPTPDELFDIYYHQHIPKRLRALVIQQATRLGLISANMSVWNGSPYGAGWEGSGPFEWMMPNMNGESTSTAAPDGNKKKKKKKKSKGKGKEQKGKEPATTTKPDSNPRFPNPHEDVDHDNDNDDVHPRKPTSGIRFTDSGSLKLLADIWRYWVASAEEDNQERPTAQDILFHRIGKAAEKREEEDVGYAYNDTRAAACTYTAAQPVGLEAVSHATWLNREYWKTGRTFSDNLQDLIQIPYPGPYSYSDTDDDDDERTDTDHELEEIINTILQKKKEEEDSKGKGKATEKKRMNVSESLKQARERMQKEPMPFGPGMTFRQINPLFFTPTFGVRINHSADPLQGFHLAPAYLPIVGQPAPKKGEAQFQRLIDTAKKEFADWCDSFLLAWREGRIMLRFCVADALSFAHTLQHHKAASLGNPVVDPGFGNWYRFPNSFNPLVIDSDDYKPVPASESHRSQAPVSFHVIDTSSLSDSLGALNVLIATSPLLENRLSATLYTEHTFPLPRPSTSDDDRLGPKTAYEVADDLLHGDLLTISTLLGLSPVDYFTNTYPTTPPPMFSSPYEPPLPPTFPPSSFPGAPPATSAAAASSSTSNFNNTTTTTPPLTAKFFNQRLTWKRPVYHDPTDGTGREWTVANNIHWPGPSPSLREEREAYFKQANHHTEIFHDFVDHCYDLAAEGQDEEREKEKVIAESSSKGGGKNANKGKGKQKKKAPPPQKKVDQPMSDLDYARTYPPDLRKMAIQKWEYEEKELLKWDRKLERDMDREREQWEMRRREMPLQKIRFQAEELVEFLSRVYSQMFEARYLFEKKDEGDSNSNSAGNASDGAVTAPELPGPGYRLLSPRICNRATFASLLKIISQRVVVIGEAPTFPDPGEEDEFMGEEDFASLKDMLKESQRPDAEFVQAECSRIMAAAVEGFQLTADPSVDWDRLPPGVTEVPLFNPHILWPRDSHASHGGSTTTPSADRDSTSYEDESDPEEDPSPLPITCDDPENFEEDPLDIESLDASYPSTIIAESSTPPPPRQSTTWDHSMDYMLETLKHSLVNYVETQGTFDQELAMILHHFGAHSSPEHATTDPDGLIRTRTYNDIHEAVLNPSRLFRRLRNWIDIPSSLAVTLRIPRHRLEVLRPVLMALEQGVHYVAPDPTGRANFFRKIQPYAPALQVCFRPTVDMDGNPDNDVPGYLFSSLQMGFGELEIKGRYFTPRFRVSIREDPLGWAGESDLFVSFMIPTSVLLRDPENGIVSVSIVPTSGPDVARRNETSFKDTGILKKDLKIFEAHMCADPFVFVTQHMPNQNGATKTRVTAKLDETNHHIASLTTRISFLTDRLRERLENEECKIRSVEVTPCSYHLIISKDPTASLWSHDSKTSHMYPLKFLIDLPLPTNYKGRHTRPRRSKGFVELETPVDPFSWMTFFTPSFIHPVHLEPGTQIPMNWSLAYVQLDALPRLCLTGSLNQDPHDRRPSRFCLWWFQLQAHRQLSFRELSAKALIAGRKNPPPPSNAADAKDQENLVKECIEQEKHFAEAIMRDLGKPGEHSRFELRLSMHLLFDVAAGIVRPKSVWNDMNLNLQPSVDPTYVYSRVFALCELPPCRRDCTCADKCGITRPGPRRVVIFIAKNGICLDLAHGTVILDTAVLAITKDMRGVLPKFLTEDGVESPIRVYPHKIMPDTLRVWKEMLPAYAERCRGQTWEHGPACEYKAKQRVPVATQHHKDNAVFCSCSMGKLPKSWAPADPIPQWEEVRPYLVRAAISLPFGCPGLGESYQHPMSWDPLLNPFPTASPGMMGSAAGTGPSALASSAAGPSRAPGSTPVPAVSGVSQCAPFKGVQTNSTLSAPTFTQSKVTALATALASGPAPASAPTFTQSKATALATALASGPAPASAPASAPGPAPTVAPIATRPIAAAKGILRPHLTSASAAASASTAMTQGQKSPAMSISPARVAAAKMASAKMVEEARRTQAQRQALASKAAGLTLHPKPTSTTGPSPAQAPPQSASATSNAKSVPAAVPAKLPMSSMCTFCGRPKNTDNGGELMKCSKCDKAQYCSKGCQTGDWKRHKKECGVAAGAGAGAVKGKENEKPKGDEKKDVKKGK